MIKLSDRLSLIAKRINEGETMADIGTDHGFLPIFLKLSGKSPHVIMADVSEPSLDKARKNAALYDDVMDFRAGDGLKVLNSYEVDAVVIAGMGGKLIRDIMSADVEHAASFKKFILQPRIGQGHLRKWLVEAGYKIVKEDLVVEGDYIPEIITALSPKHSEYEGTDSLSDGANLELSGDDMVWKIPPWIIKAEGPLIEFLERNIKMEEEKLVNVGKSRVRNEVLESKIRENIAYLKNLVKIVESEDA